MSDSKVVTSIDQITDILKANNIELVTFDHLAFYDLCLSRSYFEEFKSYWKNQSLWLGDRNGTDYIVFFSSKDLMNAPYYKKSDLKKKLKSDLYDLCVNLELVAHWEGEENYNKSDLIDLLLDVDNETYYEWYYQENSFNDLDYNFYITGYSQGEKVKINFVGKTNRVDKTEKEFLKSDKGYIPTSDYLTNIFYDTPKYLKIDCFVNDELFEEIDLIEHIDIYSYYEKSECIDAIKEHYKDFKYYDLLVQYVENHFPKTLDYS